jgi:hypothetical protein
MSGTNRRGFFRALAGELARASREPGKVAPRASDVVPAVAAMPVAPPPTRLLEIDELLAEATRVGLGRRHDALRELALVSWRLVPVEEADGVVLPAGTPWPERDGQRLAAIAQFDRSAWPSAPLADGELLTLFGDEVPAVDGEWGPVECGPLVALVTPADATRPSVATGPVVPRPELVLPRVWSAALQDLDLDDAETEAWEALRRWSADAQGTVLGDDASGLRIDRVLGYPDERRGAMPEMCELATGVPRAQWRLLAQVTAEHGSWGGRERVYVWLPDDDVTRARVIAQ